MLSDGFIEETLMLPKVTSVDSMKLVIVESTVNDHVNVEEVGFMHEKVSSKYITINPLFFG